MFTNDDPLGLYQTEDDDPLGLFSNPSQPKPEPPSLTDRFGFGIRNTIDYGRIAATNDKDEIAGIVGEIESRRVPLTETQLRMQREYEPYRERANKAEGFVDTAFAYGDAAGKRIGQFLDAPGEYAGMIAENLPNSIPGLAAGLAGAKAGALVGSVVPGYGNVVGGIVGGIVGGTAGGYATEQGSSMLEQIQKEAQARGINQQDKPAISAMIEEKYPEFLSASQRKGIATAGTDALLNTATMGLAGAGGRVLTREARALAEGVESGAIGAARAAEISADIAARNAARNTLGAKTLRGAGVTGSEMIGEGLSEAAGQKYAYGNVDAGDVIDESLLGVGTGVGMAAGSKAIDRVVGGSEVDTVEQYLSLAEQGLNKQLPPAAPQTLQLERNPDAGALIQYPDGSVAYKSEVENYINSLPEDEQPAARARFMGYAPQPGEQTTNQDIIPDETAASQPIDAPVTKSEAMGLALTPGPSLTNAAISAVDTGAHDIEVENAAIEQQQQEAGKGESDQQPATLTQATKVEQPKVDQKNIAIEIAKSLRQEIAADAQAGVIRHPQEQERSMLLGLLDVQDGGNLSNQELESRLSAKQRKDFEWLQGFAGTERIAVMRSAQQQQTTQSDLPTTPTTGESYGNQSSTQQEISTQQIGPHDIIKAAV